MRRRPEISIVVPIYNESAALPKFHADLIAVAAKATKNSYEIIYCDDGSTDQTLPIIRKQAAKNHRVKLLKLSRNFGKEYALSAGIAQTAGKAIITLDGDGQHPVRLIPKFIKAWQGGALVVVGLRVADDKKSLMKKVSSSLFHYLSGRVTAQKLISGSTDFRLIDQTVREAFLALKETNRLTRALIDWLGFEPVYIAFKANPRIAGKAAYSHRQRIRLAADSFVSLTPRPLYTFGYIGMATVALSGLLGVVIVTELLLGNPLHWQLTAEVILGLILVFLAGIIVISHALLSLYISQILRQSQQRPLYVIDYQHSIGIQKQHHA